MTTISDQVAAEVFAAAITARTRATNLGTHVQVEVGEYLYTVIVPERERASIQYRRGMGGLETLTVYATPEQDQALRSAWDAPGSW